MARVLLNLSQTTLYKIMNIAEKQSGSYRFIHVRNVGGSENLGGGGEVMWWAQSAAMCPPPLTLLPYGG